MDAQTYNASRPEAERLRLALGLTPETFTAWVRDQQSAHGLTADGKFGPATQAAVEKRKDGQVLGVDVSGHNNRPSWDFAQLAKDPPAFAYVKLTQEDFSSNADAEWQTEAFRKVGAAVGFYHFGDVSEDPVKQADLLCGRAAKVGAGKPTLPPALDLEWLDDHNGLDPAKFRAWLPKFFGRVRDNTARTPVLYTGPNFWRGYVARKLKADLHDDLVVSLGPVYLWDVDYSKPAEAPTLPVGFSSWTFRQFVGKGGRVSWYRGSMDRNEFNGTLDELAGIVR